MRLMAALVLCAPVVAVAAPEDTLRQAYQREYVFLAEERRALTKRVADYRREAKAVERDQVKTVANLEARLLQLEARGDALHQRLTAVELAAESAAGDGELVGGLIEQAGVTLESHGFGPFAGDNEEAQLNAAFAAVDKLLERMASQRQEDGEFFLEDGVAVQGTLVHLGAIASFGVSEETAGVLAPAGGGALKVWPRGEPDAARALAAGDQPGSLAMYLYDSLDQPAVIDESRSAMAHVRDGGGIAWIIVLLGLLGLVMVGLRSVLLARAGRETVGAGAVASLVSQGRMDEARALLERCQGAAARVAATVLDTYGEKRQKMEDTVSAALLEENERIDRFSTAVLVVAAVSPLLGLLGTVTGMIATFDVITQFGTGDPKMLSGGISTALITTELGLIVAIPMLFLGNLLSGWGERIKSGAERTALAMLNIEEEDRPDEPKDEESVPLSAGGRVAEGAAASPEM